MCVEMQWKVLLLAALALGESELSGPNVCIDQTEETRLVNVSYLASEKVKVMEWCIKIPPRCPRWKNQMVTKYKQEEVTRMVNHHRCCQGYQQTDDHCEPTCEWDCGHGRCAEPNVCSCDPGFSGERCNEVGCPGGNWGPDCSNPCPCSANGHCEPHTGACECLPGYEGDHCQTVCANGTYGARCAGACACSVGRACHPVTGECNPCPAGAFGAACAGVCACEARGTALCYHENGNCFCRPNFYGRRCEMHCPFGYLDGVCHREPLEKGTCSCASDLYRCDRDLGCVCKDGFDCEGATNVIDFGSLQASTDDSLGRHANAVSIAATVLLFAFIIALLAFLFYRRRYKRVQKDLEHRSVRYIENSVVNRSLAATKQNELVVSNSDPLAGAHTNYQAAESSGTNAAMVASVQMDPNVVRNSGVAGASALPNNLYNIGQQRPEKNVNIDRFKLGYAHEEEEEETQLKRPVENYYSNDPTADGACAAPEDDEEDPRYEEPCYEDFKDVNVFLKGEKESPSREKNNAMKAALDRKVNKTNNVGDLTNDTRALEIDNADNEEIEEGEDAFGEDPKAFVTVAYDRKK